MEKKSGIRLISNKIYVTLIDPSNWSLYVTDSVDKDSHTEIYRTERQTERQRQGDRET